MTTYFISRQPGALEWIEQQQIHYDFHLSHLDLSLIEAGDTIIGSLPVNIAEQVCQKKAHYKYLSLELPQHKRGKELNVADMQQLGVKIQAYIIKKENL